MRSLILIANMLTIILFCTDIYASTITSIFRALLRLEGIQSDMLNNQRSIDSLMKQLNSHVTGNSGWGTYQFHDYQSYGLGGNDWASVIRMASTGQGTGELGGMIGNLANQFPINQSAFENGTRDSNHHKYYALKSQTILAARAASQLDFNKIQDQIAYQQMLQQQIERTKDLKAAMDLSNRIQVEGNLISLQLLRQTALINQQQAVNEQGSINTALSNAKFLTKK